MAILEYPHYQAESEASAGAGLATVQSRVDARVVPALRIGYAACTDGQILRKISVILSNAFSSRNITDTG